MLDKKEVLHRLRSEEFLEQADFFLTMFIVGPLSIIFWKATWSLMDLYIFPEQPYWSVYCTIALGIIPGLALCLVQDYCDRNLTPKTMGKFYYFLLTRSYTYLGGITNVAACRGVWNLLDLMIEDSQSIMFSTFAATVAIMYIKALRNVISPPFCLIVDSSDDYFEAPTYFQTSSRETALYILDCVFSVTVVGSLVVFVWRGSWALLDIFLYPNDVVKSCWTSLIVGYALVVLTFAVQAPMRWAVARLQGAARLLIADVYHLVSFFATVNVWRGVWGLLDVYFFPDTPKLSNWCSHIVSLTLLILLNCSNSILVRGVYIDAEEPNGDCVVFPCHYLRLYFHKEKVKKRLKLAATDSSARTEEASVPLQSPEEKV